jgi:uncharacterized protein YlxW (UPF0749 family)
MSARFFGSPWRGQIAITLVAGILGLLVVIQLRTQQADPGLSALSAQELTILVANVNTRNEQLRGEVGTLQRELGTLEASQARGQSSVDQIGSDLAKIRAWAGLDPLAGRGVSIQVSGPIDGAGVEDILNELRNAGAEAIAIAGVRVVWGTVVAGSAGAASLENTALHDPFEIRAIGSPETLAGSLTRVGGVISLLATTHPRVTISVTPMDNVQVPATTRNLSPAHGAPRL